MSKKGFTLAEVMICLIIMSIVATATLMTSKPSDKYNGQLYEKAYNALNLAAFNIKAGLTGGQTFALNVMNTPQNLCNQLTTWINATNNYCQWATEIPLTATDADFADPADKTKTNPTLQFISTNGMRFFISQKFTTASANDSAAIPYTITARVVFVDFNGDRKPNTAVWNDAVMPDIVAFAITDSADVIPLGHPEIDKRYITAKYLYADGSPSESMTYYDAKNRAWGNSNSVGEIQSIVTSKSIAAAFPSTLINVTYPSAPNVDVAKGCSTFASGVTSPCKVIMNVPYN